MLSQAYLKVLAASSIYEADLSKYAKIQLFRFIEDASVDQLSVFISEGKIEDFAARRLRFFMPERLIKAAINTGKLQYNKFFGEAAKACSKPNIRDKKDCMRKYKIKANYIKLGALKREMGKCNKTQNVKKCRKLFLVSMKKLEDKIKKDRRY